ncbi:MAG: malonate decarboxylase holo-ACP synthase [Acinetobacter populi]|jgi:phosphoribosyl-dephospho-CoA transferase|uniref:malonate decarboxylase holo-ACP synthase n=1 Tax=Acinetobacter populi TaxID=1582270 RepID=UPI0023537F1D|nr:malonate decarboxylase holo-ACP synthase [Acinetobacter populi]MCH4246587.1 malonate decarboxylase holo-ACP synthase [Acinetobacter populi]
MQLQPHDLIWGLTCADLPVDIPVWVSQVIERGDPVVMRRAITGSEKIPIGIRGAQRHQRYALEMSIYQIKKCIKPEQLCHVEYEQFPHLAERMQCLQQRMQVFPWKWGYTGSMGFELATGYKTVTAQSDIDVLIRVPQYLSKIQALEIWYQLEQTALPLDVQLQTPYGGVALKEWIRAGKVLLKCNEGAVLVDNPWQQ